MFDCTVLEAAEKSEGSNSWQRSGKPAVSPDFVSGAKVWGLLNDDDPSSSVPGLQVISDYWAIKCRS